MTTAAPLSEYQKSVIHQHPTLPYRYVRFPWEHEASKAYEQYERGLGTIGLVSCAAQKLECRAPARELYRSQLFRKSIRHAEATCLDWAILSAKHGLVLPHEVLDPYDLAVTDMSRDERTAWSARVRAQIVSRWGEKRRIQVYAGRPYFGPLAGLRAWSVFGHAQIGERLKVLTERLPLACERAIHGEHVWLFFHTNGEELPGNSLSQPTAAAALKRYLMFYPDQDCFPWSTYTTRSIPARRDIHPRYYCTTVDPIRYRRHIFAKATGLTLPAEPTWITSVTPELETP